LDTRRNRARLGAHLAGDGVALGRRSIVGAVDQQRELLEEGGPHRGVPLGLLGVAADDEAVAHGALVDDDLLDLEVAGHRAIPTLPGQGRLGLGALAPELLAQDVVVAAALEVAAVLGRVEAAVGDPHDPPQPPGPQVLLDLPDERLIVGVAGPRPHADGDAGPGDREADDDLGQVGPVILGVAIGPEAPRCAIGWRVGLVGLEVGARGVEEEQVHLEVEEGGHRPEDLLGDLGLHLEQPVHGPVGAVLVELGEPRHRDVLAHPGRARELGHRLEGPVGDQREQDPLDSGVPSSATQRLGHHHRQAEPGPQAVEEPGAAIGAGLDQAQLGGREHERLAGLEHPGE
jgi:hypothetical protein